VTRNDSLIATLRSEIAHSKPFQKLLDPRQRYEVAGAAVEARALLLAALQEQTNSRVAIVVPGDAAAMFDAFFAGKMDEALKYHYKMEPLHSLMFIETNPIPVKTSLALMGKINEEFRLPLCPMSDANKAKLAAIMKEYNLI